MGKQVEAQQSQTKGSPNKAHINLHRIHPLDLCAPRVSSHRQGRHVSRCSLQLHRFDASRNHRRERKSPTFHRKPPEARSQHHNNSLRLSHRSITQWRAPSPVEISSMASHAVKLKTEPFTQSNSKHKPAVRG
ncbi:hypothetical protein Rs2_22045 [Raphanus sativus]|nr:hypothetical protein Rs2_22045 [Raphanus sativus]